MFVEQTVQGLQGFARFCKVCKDESATVARDLGNVHGVEDGGKRFLESSIQHLENQRRLDEHVRVSLIG